MASILQQKDTPARENIPLFQKILTFLVASFYFFWSYQGIPTLLLLGKLLSFFGLLFFVFYDYPKFCSVLSKTKFLWFGGVGFLFFAYLSVFYSPLPLRTLKFVSEEVFLNLILFSFAVLVTYLFDLWTLRVICRAALYSSFWLICLFFVLYFCWLSGNLFFAKNAHLKFSPLILLFRLPDWQNLFLDRQNLSSYFLFPVSFSVAYFLLAKSHFFKKIFLLAISFSFLFLLTKRSAILGILFASLLAIFLVKRFRLLLALFIFLFVFSFFVVKSPIKRFFIRENFKLLWQGTWKDWSKGGSGVIRYYGLPFYLKAILKDPLRGVGFGRKNIKIHPRTKDLPQKSHLAHAHNVFVNFALYMGVPGLFLFLIFLFGVLAVYFCALSRAGPYQWVVLAFIIYFISFWVRYQFDDSFRYSTAAFHYLNLGFGVGFSLRFLNDKASNFSRKSF